MFTTQPTVCVYDSSGTGLSDKRVLAQFWMKHGTIVDEFFMPYEPQDTTIARDKALTGAVSGNTGSDGCVTFSGLGVSTSGKVGVFSIGM